MKQTAKSDKIRAAEYNKMDEEDLEGLMHMRKRAFAVLNRRKEYSRITNDEMILLYEEQQEDEY